MALNIGDIVKVTDVQNFLGQEVLNVYFYEVTAAPEVAGDNTPYEQICASFNADVRIYALPIQSVQLTHSVTRVDNLTNGLDFAEVAVSVAGQDNGAPLASFYALNFILRRTTKLTRNGSKRLAGITENNVDGNGWSNSYTPLNNYGNAVASPLLDAAEPTANPFASPVIVGRRLVGEKYEYDLSKINPIASAGVTAVSTQRSRKVGHGG